MTVETELDPQQSLEAKNAFDGSLVFGTGHFNRRTGRDQHIDRRKRIRDYWVDADTGALRPELTESRDCPGCWGRDRRELFVKEGFPHVECADCSLVYVAPVLREEALVEYYAEEESWTEVLFNEDQVELDRRKFEYGLDALAARVAPSRLLDVGCGPGFFLDAARQRGWEVEGMEVNERCVERLRGQGIPVCTDPLEHSSLAQGSYGAVAMWEVLEHLRDPVGALCEARRLLADGGVLLICVPNFGSLVNRIMHENAGTFAGYSHINFFVADTLVKMQQDTGFEVAGIETVITELGTIQNWLSFADPYLGSADAVLPLLTPEYIHDHLLGSRLLTVATAR